MKEDTHVITPESSVPEGSLIGVIPRSTAPSLQLDASKDLSRMIKKRRAPLKNKQIKIKTPVLGVDTNRAHRYRNKQKEVRKQAKVRSVFSVSP